jgi:spore germination protein YaaH
VLLFSNYNNRLGDFDEPRAHRMLVRAHKRTTAARALARRAAGFRGVQIDLESLRRRDTRSLVSFTRAVRRALPRGKTVSMAFMASSNARGYAARGYNLTALSRLLDVAALMTYDQHGPWSGPGPIAALPWVRAELRYFLTRVPRSKVDLGAAAYGYQWGGGASEVTVPQARSLAGSRAAWNATYGEWQATLPGGRRLWWDDARSVALRRQLAVAQHLHGLAIWQIGSSGRLQP